MSVLCSGRRWGSSCKSVPIGIPIPWKVYAVLIMNHVVSVSMQMFCIILRGVSVLKECMRRIMRKKGRVMIAVYLVSWRRAKLMANVQKCFPVRR